MVLLQYDPAPAKHVIVGRDVEFDHAPTDVPYERACEAVATYDDVAFVYDHPQDYDALRQLAAQAQTDAVDGNATKAAIIEWLDQQRRALDGRRP